MQDLRIMFNLIASVACEKPLASETKNALTPEKLQKIFKKAKEYDLAHLIAEALDRAGALPDGEEREDILNERRVAVMRVEQMLYESNRITEVFEREKIPYLPLKGMILRNAYPETWMRTSCDIDVLVQEKDSIRAAEALCKAYGYEQQILTDHDVSLFSEFGVHLELHHCLLEKKEGTERERNTLSKAWEYVRLKDGQQYGYEMTDEMFYFYHVLHAAKHFRIGGCGIRPFLDLWLLNHRVQFDQEKRDALLREGGLTEFAKAATELSEVWFSDAEESELTKRMTEYVFRAGLYGGTRNRLAVNAVKKGKFRYLLSRVFLPHKQLATRYPVLKKWPILHPFCQVARWFSFLGGNRKKESLQELKTVTADTENQKQVDWLFKALEL